MWKKILFSIFFIVLSIFLHRFCFDKTDGFQVLKIKSSIPFDSQWETSALREDQVSPALDQSFYYLGKGRRCYAFVSQDKKYVLKFVRTFQITPPLWSRLDFIRYVCPALCEKAFVKKEALKIQNFTSYKIGFEELKEQTGTLLVHLNTKPFSQNPIILYDKIGVKHSLLLDDLVFILQKKADSFFVVFQDLLAKGQEEEAKKLLSKLAFLLKSRADQRIADWDLSIGNLGILDGELIAFDLDGLKKVSAEQFSYKNHMMRSGKRMIKWLENDRKDLSQFLVTEMERLIEAHVERR